LVVYGAVMAVTLLAGLGMRFGSLGLPGFAVKYGGSTMWALMIYWVVALVLRGSGPGRVMVLAGMVATAVEFLKLYRTPSLDAFRGTLPGILLLGKYFSVWDIVAYWMAIGVGRWWIISCCAAEYTCAAHLLKFRGSGYPADMCLDRIESFQRPRGGA